MMNDPVELREVEKMKIKCGSKHFALCKKNDVEYKLVVAVRDLYL